MDIIGLPFDRYSGKLLDYNSISSYDYDELDGCFRMDYKNKCVTDGTGYLPTYFDLDERRILEFEGCEFYKRNYIPVPMNCEFDYDTRSIKLFNSQKIIKNDLNSVFDYFEDWFCSVYENLIQEYHVFQFITTGLDSRYLLSIIYSRGLKKPELVTYGEEGKQCKKIFDNVTHINEIIGNYISYIKLYINYYSLCGYDSLVKEFDIYSAYGAISKKGNDIVIIDGLGRNNYMTGPLMCDSFSIQKIRTTYTAGRAPYILGNKIRSFFPYAGKDIRYNIRRFNLTEVQLCTAIHERIKRNVPEFASIQTGSFEKCQKSDNKFNFSYKDIIEMHNSTFKK